LIILFFIFFNFGIWAQEQPQEVQPERPSASSDLVTSLKWLVQGSYKQFDKNNLYTLGVAVPATWYAFNQDDYIVNSTKGKSVSEAVQIVADSSVFFATPVLQIGLYYIGRGNENTKMMQYAMEMFSTTYLTFAETFLLSYIDIHQRPDSENLDELEQVRGNSSFTSGHMIAYTTLFSKTLQFYGPWWSLIPLTATVMTGYERVVAQKHYLSDVVGGFFLTLFASEGVRVAGQWKDNSPVFKFIFEHDVKVGYSRKGDSYVYRLSWSF
ncbi:MAG: phosphatase PAP2 family protein, partial [Bacteriovoracales bacterium]